MLAVERRRVIRSALEQDGSVRTTDLCKKLNVSAVTIRADLRILEQESLCEMIWGGAVIKKTFAAPETTLDRRSRVNSDHKARIGKHAATLIKDGQTVIIDAGTTTVEVMNYLPHDFNSLRIITPALNVAVAATQYDYLEVVVPGGILRKSTHSLIGPNTLQTLDMFNADWAFLGCGGFHISEGITTGHLMELEVKRKIVEQALNVALVADSSKFGCILSLNVVALDQIDLIITDTNLAEKDRKAIQAQGTKVVCV